MTRREEIERRLSETEMSAQDLANIFKVTAKEIEEDLNHIKQSIKPKRLLMIPAHCRACTFVFKERSRINRPSKCPRCKNERIEEARFKIK